MEKLTFNSEHISVAGHKGKWYVIDDGLFKKGEKMVHAFLLEHETYGDMAACIIVDEKANLIMDEVFNGFSDLEENGWEQVSGRDTQAGEGASLLNS